MHYQAKVFGFVERFPTMAAADSWRGQKADQLGARWPDTSLRHVGDDGETLLDAPMRSALISAGCTFLSADHPRVLAAIAKHAAAVEADELAEKIGRGFDADQRWIDAAERAHAPLPSAADSATP